MWKRIRNDQWFIGIASGVIVTGIFALTIKLVAVVVGSLVLASALFWLVRDYERLRKRADGNARLLRAANSQIRRLWLHDVIHSARVSGWTVEDDSDGELAFVSPDDDVYFVREINPSPERVAKDLSNVAPDHFSEKSIPFIARVGGDAAVARAMAERLEKQVADLEASTAGLSDLPREIMKVRLADVLEPARELGWGIEWGKSEVVFSQGDDMATLTYGNPSGVDLRRLRTVLGIDVDRDALRESIMGLAGKRTGCTAPGLAKSLKVPPTIVQEVLNELVREEKLYFHPHDQSYDDIPF